MADPNDPLMPTASIGAVDAKPGTKLYEMALRRAANKARFDAARQRRQVSPQQRVQALRQQALAQPGPEEVMNRLMGKFEQGVAQPGPGMVPFGELPGEVRRGMPGAMVGVDPRTLAPDEMALLEQLRAKGREELAARMAQQEMAAKGRLP